LRKKKKAKKKRKAPDSKFKDGSYIHTSKRVCFEENYKIQREING